MMTDGLSNPYETNAIQLRDLLSDPNINRFEHEVVWPRFVEHLPPAASRILDFGCGAGNFTFELANRYPDAEVIGVDSAQGMLPDSAGACVFRVWDGMGQSSELGKFDLIVAKMSLHYVPDLPSVTTNIGRLLTPDGHIVVSAPHPVRPDLARNWELAGRHEYHTSKQFVHQIGSTGIQAVMQHHKIEKWINLFMQLSPHHVMRMDELGHNNDPKRLIIALRPRT